MFFLSKSTAANTDVANTIINTEADRLQSIRVCKKNNKYVIIIDTDELKIQEEHDNEEIAHKRINLILLAYNAAPDVALVLSKETNFIDVDS